MIKAFSNKFHVHSESFLWLMFAVHVLLSIGYAVYAANSTSDSIAYYAKAKAASDWFSTWGIGTPFIYFLAWPFASLFNLSYYSCMIIFSFFGYVAIVLFYITAKENIKLEPVWLRFTVVELVFLLPNLHFWSASIGKGAVILLGLALFTFGLSRFNRRIFSILIGGLLTFMIRPHILFTAVVSVMLGIVLTSSGIKPYLRWVIFIAAGIVFLYISDDVLKFADTESLDILSSSSLSHRASELSKASSGVDIQNYGILMKMFTFWFRPLFFDGQGVVGILVSFENLLYIFMFYTVIKKGILHWGDWNGWFRICLFFFLFGSFALAQVTGNLGIAMRQKAQLMPFFFLIFCKASSYKGIVTKRFVRI
ncbi:MAG: hypothetical protein H7258_10310 [Ferruginibacter sp.]|nr:hypothetical protein [Ferruginibacter sp.]